MHFMLWCVCFEWVTCAVTCDLMAGRNSIPEQKKNELSKFISHTHTLKEKLTCFCKRLFHHTYMSAVSVEVVQHCAPSCGELIIQTVKSRKSKVIAC